MPHAKQRKYFDNAIKQNRLAHAYALVGEKGAGRLEFVENIAKSLESHPVYDLFIYDSEKSFGVKEARELQDKVKLKSAGYGFKVGVIVDAETMSLPAANALLKTLEEPPKKSVIFLLTDNFYQLLPTIQSRVQRVNFGRQELEEIKEWKKYYQVLENGSQKQRLITAEEVAGLEVAETQMFLIYAMKKWVGEGKKPGLAEKLKKTHEDLARNLNTKLVVDNLFL